MAYAEMLRQRFAGLDPTVDDLFLFEAHQIADLPDRAPAGALAAVLHAHPRVRRFFVARQPAVEAFLAKLLTEHDAVDGDELAAHEAALLWELADWIVYQRDPARYDERSGFDPGLSAITDVVDLDGKVVIDAGAGTGQVALAVAPFADHVYAVEPVANLRRYLRDRVRAGRIDNLYVLDGFLHDIPLPPSSADVLLTRNAIGWHLSDELAEIDRVVAPGGLALHLYGMPHPAPPDDEVHAALIAAGYRADSYVEGDSRKRRYWQPLDGRRLGD